MADKVVLAYSGGLDTSAAIKWLADRYMMEVIALTADIGGVGELTAIQQKALKIGAVRALTPDARKMFGLCERFARAEASRLFYSFHAK
jgi:argininosuccinate synthase